MAHTPSSSTRALAFDLQLFTVDPPSRFASAKSVIRTDPRRSTRVHGCAGFPWWKPTTLALGRTAGRTGAARGGRRRLAAEELGPNRRADGARRAHGSDRRDDWRLAPPASVVATTAVAPVGDPRTPWGVGGPNHGKRRGGNEQESEQKSRGETEGGCHAINVYLDSGPRNRGRARHRPGQFSTRGG